MLRSFSGDAWPSAGLACLAPKEVTPQQLWAQAIDPAAEFQTRVYRVRVVQWSLGTPSARELPLADWLRASSLMALRADSARLLASHNLLQQSDCGLTARWQGVQWE